VEHIDRTDPVLTRGTVSRYRQVYRYVPYTHSMKEHSSLQSNGTEDAFWLRQTLYLPENNTA
jgi:hypothetical protein